MISIWRIEKKKYASVSFSGDGAYAYGGRWNHPGTRVVYASETLALCALEKFVHLESAAAAIEFVCFKISVPEQVKIKKLELSSLPANWRDCPVPAETMDIGTKWARKNETVLLSLPSTIIPLEYDYLINPAHPDHRHLRFSKPLPFSFDPRLWKTSGRGG